jgi:hypothetical protein
MMAHQKIIRDRRAAERSDADMFGNWWQGIDIDIAKADIREVSYETAKAIIEKYEWLGTMPAVSRFYYGIFFGGCCGGVVVYGDEYAENLGVWDKYDFTGRIIALLRGACVHWAHPHSASKLIRESMKLLPAKYKVITATTDSTAGEVGTIYQACGFAYVGTMSAGGKRASVNTKSGKAMSGRQAGRIYGTRGHDALTALGVDNDAVPRKGRYFGFRGSRSEIKQMEKAISHLVKPYPKRAGKVSSRDTVGTTDKDGGSSHSPLQDSA